MGKGKVFWRDLQRSICILTAYAWRWSHFGNGLASGIRVDSTRRFLAPTRINTLQDVKDKIHVVVAYAFTRICYASSMCMLKLFSCGILVWSLSADDPFQPIQLDLFDLDHQANILLCILDVNILTKCFRVPIILCKQLNLEKTDAHFAALHIDRLDSVSQC